jgi:hypothetical protein
MRSCGRSLPKGNCGSGNIARWSTAVGITTVGYVVITLATGSAVAFLHGAGTWRPIALRAGGSWAAAVGIMVLGLHLATAR